MALYFNRRRRWPPSRPVQFVLAFLTLALAIAVLVAWLMIGYHQNAPAPSQEQETTTSSQAEIVTDIGRCLVILDLDDTQHFLLVQTDPATPQITIKHIPGNLAVEDSTLHALFKKHGSPRAVQSVAEVLNLPISHYITLEAKGIENFINQFEDGITYTLPESIRYTDENDSRIHLDAKEYNLTGSQVKEILRYNDWDNANNQSTVAADLLCALFNQHMNSELPLKAYFGLLANDAVTDLRIDNFNAYHTALTQIAQGNYGDVCRIDKLKGTTKKEKFIPN